MESETMQALLESERLAKEARAKFSSQFAQIEKSIKPQTQSCRFENFNVEVGAIKLENGRIAVWVD